MKYAIKSNHTASFFSDALFLIRIHKIFIVVRKCFKTYVCEKPTQVETYEAHM